MGKAADRLGGGERTGLAPGEGKQDWSCFQTCRGFLRLPPQAHSGARAEPGVWRTATAKELNLELDGRAGTGAAGAHRPSVWEARGAGRASRRGSAAIRGRREPEVPTQEAIRQKRVEGVWGEEATES